MKGEAIRREREARGLTQTELARLIGRSQATISAIENGRAEASTVVLARIERVLRPAAQTKEEHEVLTAGLPRWEAPSFSTSKPLPRFLAAAGWCRPAFSGDQAWVMPLGSDAAIVAAVDIAGHGASVFPAAAYVRGWIEGWVAEVGKPPALGVLAQQLSNELRAARVDAACFLATIRRHSSTVATYEGMSWGFPPPLLITGPPFATRETARLGPPLPADQLMPEITTVDRLAGPWRLVVASDGLLRRLGHGDEQTGLRALRLWQSGPERDIAPNEWLDEEEPVGDDEVLLVVRGDVWREYSAFSSEDEDERGRILELIRRDLAPLNEETASAFAQAVLEALDNAGQHAYPDRPGGIIRVRRQHDDRHYRVEIEDEGRDRVSRATVKKRESGFAVMRQLCHAVDVRRRADGGTIVTLVLDKEEAKREKGP